jgi:hypothetical protein
MRCWLSPTADVPSSPMARQAAARGRLRAGAAGQVFLWHAARGALYGFGCGLPLTGRPALCRAKMGGHRPKAISGEHRPAVVLQRETSRYAAWWPNWLSAGLRSVSLGVAVCPRREAELQKRPGGWRTRSGGGRCG